MQLRTSLVQLRNENFVHDRAQQFKEARQYRGNQIPGVV